MTAIAETSTILRTHIHRSNLLPEIYAIIILLMEDVAVYIFRHD